MNQASAQAVQSQHEASERLVERVAKVAAQASGLIQLGERGDFLQRRLTTFIGTAGESALEALLARAERGEAAAVQELRNVLAVNYTYFWREPEHFQFLLEHLLTTLRVKVGVGRTAPRALRLWSSACSSGEEAWSMAIVAAEALRLTGSTAHIEILATDIDTAALDEARSGLYRDEVMQQLPGEYRDRYLQRTHGTDHRRWQISDALRAMVHFHPLDLLATQWPICEATVGQAGHCGGFDVIFCRNVLIYFSDSARFHVFEKFAALLRSDGLIFTSRVENGLESADHYFRAIGDAVYLLRAQNRTPR